MNPIFYIDFYKVGHVIQYPPGTTQVWANWTPRNSRVPGRKDAVHFGVQYLIQKYLIGEFQEGFFSQPLSQVLSEYKEVIRQTLGVADPKTDHIEALHRVGMLPVKIYSIPEGDSLPLGVPGLVITNTLPEFFWLPNYLETLLSCILWKPSTSATTAQAYRRLFTKYALESGETDLGFVEWMGHDFSFRGMSGLEDAVLSGMGHLLSFSGTDTIPAILAAQKYYNATLAVGGSVPATEHSVMCAGGFDDEFGTFKRLLTEVYPSGVVSIVSDTWDLWTVLTMFVPRLKDVILARNGKLVIRPDSGDPVKIICGSDDANYLSKAEYPYPTEHHPSVYGTLQLLADSLGVDRNRPGLPMINKAGAIYGDSITLERADQILDQTVNKLGLSPYNMVFGIGSFTYEYVTRDTNGYAMKATAIRNSKQEVIPIYKKPVTDDGGKVSHKGIPVVYRDELSSTDRPVYFVKESVNPTDLDNCAMQLVFENGNQMVYETFNAIRERVRR